MIRRLLKALAPRPIAVDQPLADAVLQLAARYDAASRGESVTPPAPAWLGEIAAELRGLTEGAVL